MKELEIIKIDVNKLIKTGLNLNKILEKLNDFNEDMIKTSYYQLNNGPDLRDYQIECYEKFKNSTTNKEFNFKMFWCCGLGKTIMALTICKKMKYKNICIALPNILLLEQFEKELQYFYPNVNIYKVCSSSENKNFKYFSGNTEKDLSELLTSNEEYKIILTTYHSSKIIEKISNELKFVFDIIICDECHHLLNKSNNSFNKILNIKFRNRLLLTATPNILKENNKFYSLYDSKIFEGEFDIHDITWSIENKYITDYRLVIMYDTLNLKEELTSFGIEFKYSKLFISAYMCLKSIYQGLSNKVLIYCNTVNNSKIIHKIIDKLIYQYNGSKNYINKFGLNLNLKNLELNGNHPVSYRRDKLNELKLSEYGILSSVQLFGEGFDYPDLDTVIFSEKMTSNIRIIQSALRPCRINNKDPHKIAKIILPITEEDNYGNIKQVLTTFNNIDDPLGKLRILNMTKKKKYCYKKRILKEKFCRELDKNSKDLLEKIELTYLKKNLLNKNIINPNCIIDIKKINNILLLPLSEKSFVNFYKSVIRRDFNNCYWGQKYNDECSPNYKIWDKIGKNDLLVFIEKNKISFGIVNKKEENRELAEELWNDSIYGLIYNFTIKKRIDIDKKKFMVNIGYKETDNLMSSRIYKGEFKKHILKLV